MVQEEELRRQQAQLQAAGPAAPPADAQLRAAQEAQDRRAAALDKQAAMIKGMNEEMDQRSSRLKEAAQAVAARERELSERENALRLAAGPAAPELQLAPPMYTMEPAPAAPEPSRAPAAAGTLSDTEIRECLAQAEGLLSEARLAGADVTQVSEQINMARELMDERKFEDASAAARKSIEMARAARDSASSRKRSELVEAAQQMIAENKQLGIQVAEAEALLDKAVAAVQSAQTELADKYAQEAQEKAKAASDGYGQATESMQRLDTVYRQAQARKPDIDLRDVTAVWGEASAAFDKGDYATAAELARKAEKKLNELDQAKAAQKAAAPAPPAQKYRCPSCAKVFQVVPPAFRPFDVGCPHCHTVVRISK
jgi:hypothetical protein